MENNETLLLIADIKSYIICLIGESIPQNEQKAFLSFIIGELLRWVVDLDRQA